MGEEIRKGSEAPPEAGGVRCDRRCAYFQEALQGGPSKTPPTASRSIQAQFPGTKSRRCFNETYFASAQVRGCGRSSIAPVLDSETAYEGEIKCDDCPFSGEADQVRRLGTHLPQYQYQYNGLSSDVLWSLNSILGPICILQLSC